MTATDPYVLPAGPPVPEDDGDSANLVFPPDRNAADVLGWLQGWAA